MHIVTIYNIFAAILSTNNKIIFIRILKKKKKFSSYEDFLSNFRVKEILQMQIILIEVFYAE